MNLEEHANELSQEVARATSGAKNEANLRHEIEKALESHCKTLNIPWVYFTFETALKSKKSRTTKFADAIHGAVVIEYEPPKCFKGKQGSALKHAQGQAEEYALLIHYEEGRDLESYILVAWDGSHISFGKYLDSKPVWEELALFDTLQAEKLLRYIKSDGVPLVHPMLLSNIVGPESQIGTETIPKLYNAILLSCNNTGTTNKTKLLFTEWKRLFSQVIGTKTNTTKIKKLLKEHEQCHGANYSQNISEYLFALNTYIALVAKTVAALSLPNADQNLSNPNVDITTKVELIESGDLFLSAGILDMLTADFFSWYADDPSWGSYHNCIEKILHKLAIVNYDINKKNVDSTRDLFKGIYESFVPREIRHSLGEYYTPDWLAEHMLDSIEWKEEAELLDPTCGSGTFLIEALKRRFESSKDSKKTAAEYLTGIYGIDLNPLAVITAKASIVVFLSPFLEPENPVRIPVFLADAINPAVLTNNCYEHFLQTELGTKFFKVPHDLVSHEIFFVISARVRDLINAGLGTDKILTTIESEFHLSNIFNAKHEYDALRMTLDNLVELHQNGWDGIWCYILADRFAAAAIPKVRYIAGNPPWVKWSNLPKEYAEFIKPQCTELGLFSDDRWVGGIESDISIIVTYKVVEKWLEDKGLLGFLITGTVFSNESSQGFRRFNLPSCEMPMKVLRVEDFKAIKPFDNTANHPTFMVLEKGTETTYPLSYTYWAKPRGTKNYSCAHDFYSNTTSSRLHAIPMPGKEAGPWLRGNKDDHEFWGNLFGGEERHYTARKGITTDLNGVYFVKVLERLKNGKVKICNDPSMGKKPEIPQITMIVEDEHVFPLLRGRGVKQFNANIDPEHHVIIPQREMHGDPDLLINAPQTYKFLNSFKRFLEKRSSYKRFQSKQPPWSVWSTGKYTFCNYKVLWKEMSGRNFSAAYVGSTETDYLDSKVIIPDHKLYFVPFDSEDEAAFFTGFLNAPVVTRGIISYSEDLLSLGASVVEYLNIPKYDPANMLHHEISKIAKQAHNESESITPFLEELDIKVKLLLDE